MTSRGTVLALCMLDRVLDVDASLGGGDQGYSGWTETEDGRIFVVNYTDDRAPACLATPNWPTGLPWICGTWLQPSDLKRTNVNRSDKPE